MQDASESTELLVELIAIDVWDSIFENTACPDEIEKIARMTRQVRKQEIRRRMLSSLSQHRCFLTCPPQS